MATLAGLIDRARLEIGDLGRPFQSQVVGDGTLTSVTIPHKPVDAASLLVSKTSPSGTIPFAAPNDYTLDERNGTLTLTVPLASDESLTVQGTAYRYFTQSDWSTFVNTAYGQHTHGRAGTLARLDPVEDYLVALLAVVQGLYALMNDSAFDIDIATPEGISIPRHQRFDQLMQMLMARMDQYNRLASALNVGLNRIEMYTLRRISRMTGRLVPIYIAQEIDEATPPRRVFPTIDLQGANPLTDRVAVYDLVGVDAIEVGVPFEVDVLLNQPIAAGTTMRAQLRKNELGAPLIYFTTTVTDATTGAIKITLADTSRTRMYFNGDAFWDLKLTDSAGITRTYLKGRVEVIERPFL